MTTEPQYINYTTDEPGMHAHTDTHKHTHTHTHTPMADEDSLMAEPSRVSTAVCGLPVVLITSPCVCVSSPIDHTHTHTRIQTYRHTHTPHHTTHDQIREF